MYLMAMCEDATAPCLLQCAVVSTNDSSLIYLVCYTLNIFIPLVSPTLSQSISVI